MIKYVITNALDGDNVIPRDFKYTDALKAVDNFGLYHLTVEEVIAIWEDYCENQGDQWISFNKEDVEDCFGVSLEEVYF